MDLIFDIETNGLIGEGTEIHCISAMDHTTGQVFEFPPSLVDEGVELLASPDVDRLVGHNISGFDIPFIHNVLGVDLRSKPQIDTFAVSRALFVSTLTDSDYRRLRHGSFPKRLVGKFSLESWGYRLNLQKGTFAQSTDWQTYSEEMMTYCTQDVAVTARLYDMLLGFERVKHKPAMEASMMEVESRIHGIMGEQERCGVAFDEGAAMSLVAELQTEKHALTKRLQEIYPAEYISKGEFTPKRPNKTMGYGANATCTKIQLREFNPGSDQQVAERLIKAGWTPSAYTPKGQPKVDEKNLVEIDTSKMEGVDELIKYKLVDKRLGQIYEGKAAWMRKVEAGRIHGRVQTTGTRTGRMSHSSPNLAQVPRVGSFMGAECRRLFGPQHGGYLVGIDASGLELRTLANRIHRYDGGAFAKEVIDGDIHTVVKEAIGLNERNNAKSFVYAWLYGAGSQKLGEVIANDLRAAGQSVPRDLAALGKKASSKMMKRIKGLSKLLDAVKSAHNRGFIRNVAGLYIQSASEHSALNSCLQSDGAAIMKWAQFILDKHIRDLPCQTLLTVHDEWQIECWDEDIAHQVGEIAVNSIRGAGEALDLKVELDGEYQVGRNWEETH